MSRLETLGIAGFRGYSKDRMEKIDFGKPLTIIYGKNGSGKTTIIQCLKFITSGSLPPSSDRGKHFVQDDRLAQCSEVNAVVKLKFQTRTKRQMLAERTMLLSRTAKGLKVESKHQILKTKDQNGHQISINHQCAEIQKQIPQFLGISKPILENIVFCHQDESLWPFSDNNTLKSIFDELFQTRKMTKIIEQLWDVQREQNKKLKEIKILVDHLRETYEQQLKRKQTNLRTLEETVQLAEETGCIKAQLDQELSRKNASVAEGDQMRIKLIEKGSLAKSLETIRNQIANNQIVLNKVPAKDIEALVKGNSSKEVLEMCKQELEGSIVSLREQLVDLNEQNKQALLMESTDSVQSQINIELSGLRDLFPSESLFNLDESIIFLEKRCRLFEQYGHQLSFFRKESSNIRIVDPNHIAILSDKEKTDALSNLQNSQNKLTEANKHIFELANNLYTRVPPQTIPQKSHIRHGIEQEITKVQASLEHFYSEKEHYETYLEAYERAQKRRKEISRAQIIENEVIPSMYQFCNSKHKCPICMQSLSEEVVEGLIEGYETRKVKGAHKIGKMKQEAQNDQVKGVFSDEVNPRQQIDRLNSQIQENVTRREELQKALHLHQQAIRLTQALERNSYVERLLQNHGLDKRFKEFRQVNSSPEIQKTNSIQLERMLVTNSESQRQQERLKLQLDSNEQRIVQKKELQQQQTAAITKREKIEVELRRLQTALSQEQLIRSIFKKLQNLKERTNFCKKKVSTGKKVMKSAQIGQLISDLTKQLKDEQKTVDFLTVRLKQDTLIQICQEKQVQARKLEQEIQALRQQMSAEASRMERLTQLKLQYQRMLQQVQYRCRIATTGEPKPVCDQYFSNLHQIKYYEQSVMEIERISQSVEDAVTSYHYEKMEEINRILADLWREVYHGPDIETIKVCTTYSEEEANKTDLGLTSGARHRKKRNYNYNIVMLKNVVEAGKTVTKEIDMKGRCSMGQKVLASLIIRLALAEAFSTSSLILALDEPTTNLDKDHMHNLAEQLIKLVETCKNMQLIIISHQEEFVEKLSEYTTHFYEISRDSENFSIIRKRAGTANRNQLPA